MKPRLSTAAALFVGLICTMALLGLLTGPATPAQADPGVLYVAPDGGCGGATPCYATIQDAVDAATNGDTIKVAQSTYTSTAFQVVYINKAITLTGGYSTTDWANSYPITRPSVVDAENVSGRRGIYIDGTGVTTITLIGLTIQRGSVQYANGAGIYILTGMVVLQDSQVLSNMARGTDDKGGGVYIGGGTLILNDNTFQSNSADTDGGGAYAANSTLTLSGNTFQSNSVTAGSGAGAYVTNGSAEFTDNLFQGNSVRRWGNFYGGGVYVSGSNVILNGNSFQGNLACYGGGVHVRNSIGTLSSNIFQGNSAAVRIWEAGGGGMHIMDSDVTVSSNTFQGNSTIAAGGGVHVAGGTVTLSSNTIVSNMASEEGALFSRGGGVYIANGNFTLKSNAILNNTTNASGGGIYVWGNGYITLTGNTIHNNTAQSDGGGMYIFTLSGITTLSSNIVLSNTANTFGGGVSVSSGAVIAQNDIIANNTAPWEGVYLSGGSLTARHWTLANNGNYALRTNVGVAVLTNTIVASHTLGGFWGANTTADHTLFFNSGTPCSGGAVCTNTFTGDPKFINPAAGDYHIGPGSAAIDTGVDAGVYDDIDGDIRPMHSGFDIGADEFPYPPVASFTSSTPDWAGQGTVFTNTTVVTSAVVSYLWDFGDGTFGTVVSPTHVYTLPGTFTVVLTASNPAGGSVATDTVTIYAAAFTSNSPHQPGRLTVFTNTTVTSGTTTYLWSFGDDFTSTLESPTHSYAAPGAYTVILTATNFAGSGVATGQVLVDGTPPTGAIVVNNGDGFTTLHPVTLTLSASDAESGVADMAFSDNGVDFTAYEPYATLKAWTLPAGDGVKTVYVRFRDVVGNVSPVYSDTIVLDSTPPQGSVTINDGAGYTNNPSVTLVLSATDLYGVPVMALSDDGVTYGEWVSYTPSYSWTLTPGDGSKTVYARFRDPAGNVVTASDNIVFDTISPAGSLTIADVATYVPTQTVTLHSNVSDTNGVAQMHFSNDGVSYSGWLSFTSLYTWTLAVGDGAKVVYGQYRDTAGNESAILSDTVILDTQPPMGSMSINADALYANSLSVTLNLSATDLSGVEAFQVSDDGLSYSGWINYATSYSWTLPSGDGQKTVYVRFRDVVGHESNPVTDTIVLDTIAPEGSIVINNGTTYATSVTVTLTLSATDATTGLSQMQFSNDGSNWSGWEPYATAQVWTLASGDGEKTVHVRYSDVAGNTVVFSDTIILDTTPPGTSAIPSGSAGNNGWWQSSVEITLTASDATSAVDQTEYRVDENAWQTYAIPFTVSVDRVHTVEYCSVDIAGNREITQSLVVRIDTVPPSTTAILTGTPGSGEWYVSDVQVRLSASDDTSGIDVIHYRLNGGTWQTYSGTFTVEDGIYTVEYQSTDLAGNQDVVQSQTVHVDTTPPSAAVNTLTSYQTALTFNVSWSGADATSGLANYDVQYRDSAIGIWTDWITATTATSASFTGQDGRTYDFRARARDQAGNISAYSSSDTQTTVDVTPPTPGGLTINGGALSSTVVTVTLAASATDATSGVSWMSFSNDGNTWRNWEPYAASTTWSLTGYGTILMDGPKTVYGRFKDAAGNVSSAITSAIELNTTVGTNYGLSINDGALYTNQTAVTLTISAEPETAQMMVSNDGGFAGAQWEPYSSHKAWTITQYGNYVIPRVVYVRYKDIGGNVSGNYQDDIILDVTPPTGTVTIVGSSSQMLVASSSVTLRLNATDDVSGVGGMLISNQPDFAGATWEAYTTTRAWTLGSNQTVYARFRDNAGNISQTYSASSGQVFLPLVVR